MRFLRPCALLVLVASFLWQSGASPSAATTTTGSVSLTTADVAYTQDFNSLLNTPDAALSAALPAGWAIDETGTSARNDGKYAVGTGSSNTGDTFAYGTPVGNSDRALGTLRSGTLIPVIGASFTNNTGQSITSLDVAYIGEQWRLGTSGRADRLDFQIGVAATSINTGTFTDVDSLDFSSPITTGTVGLLNGNLGANRVAISAAITGLNIPNGSTFWIRWTDFDATGADDGLAVDDFSLTPHTGVPTTNPSGTGAANPGSAVPGGSTLLTVTVTPGTSPASTGLAVTANLTAIGGAATQPFFDDATHGDAAAGDNTFSFSATVGVVSAGVKSLPVTITDAQSRTGTTAIAFTVDRPVTAIHDIQGAGATSPFTGIGVTTEGIVTGVKFNGFFIQAPDAEVDASADTSEGVFVFTGSSPGPPAAAVVGNRVRVSGNVSEFKSSTNDPEGLSSTEIVSPSTALISTGNPLPAAVTLTGADLFVGASFLQLEKYEGMRVHMDAVVSIAPTDGTVDEVNARSTSSGLFFGVLPGAARPFREPGIQAPLPVPPEAPAGATPPIFDGDYERIGIDTFSVFNDPATAAVFPPPPGSTLDVTTGVTVTNITGPLDYAFRSYIVDAEAWDKPAAATANAVFTPVSDRADGEFTVATSNMERFFDTINDPSTSDAVLTPAAFDGRVQKASLVIRDVLKMPDIIGVEEMENLPTLQIVADRVNADAISAGLGNPDYHAFLAEGNDIGGIDSGLLVRGDRVDLTPGHFTFTQYGQATTYVEPGGSAAILNDRPPIVLEASILNPPYEPYAVTVIVNHLRSLSGVDDTDGLRIRTKRRIQAEYLAQLIRSFQDQGKRVISVGDYNAFGFNDGYVDVVGIVKGAPAPANETTQSTTLTAAQLPDPPLTDVIQLAPADQQYSFMFDGIAQELDHILVTGNLLVNRVGYGRVNADFPETYRGDVTRPERNSDHDPFVAYFNTPNVDTTPPLLTVPADISVEGNALGGAIVDFTATAHDGVDGDITPTCAPATGSLFPLGSTVVSCSAMDSHGNSATLTFHVTVTDTVAPALQLPADATVEALDASGAPFTYVTSASDIVSGSVMVVCVPGSGSTFALGVTTVACAAHDASGNQATGQFTVTVVDTTPPSISIVRPAAVDYLFMQAITASYSCADAASGVATCAGPVPSGGAIDTSTEGTHTFTVTATDVSGNVRSQTVTYTVSAVEGRMTGAGEIDTADGRENHFEFRLAERHIGAERGALRFSVKTPKAGKRPEQTDTFEASSIETIAFWNDPAFRPGTQPRPTTDSVIFTGAGTWNGAPGYTFDARATDEGEPGRGHDTFSITIRNGSVVVATVSGTIDQGNIQSERLQGR